MSIDTEAPEKGTFYIVITFKDEDSNEVVPESAYWTLTDKFGKIINERDNVEISTEDLDTSVTVKLSGDDLKIIQGHDKEERFFLIKYIYNSNLGTGITSYEEGSFFVKNYRALK
jgi:hypothetical protein